MLTPSQLFPKSYGGALLHIKRWPCFCCQGPSTLEQQRLAWHCFIFKGINKAKKSPFLENTRSREQPFSTTEPGCHLTLSVFMSKKNFWFSDVLHTKVDKLWAGIYSEMWPADVSVFKWGHRLFFTDVYLWLPLTVWRCPVVRSMLEVKKVFRVETETLRSSSAPVTGDFSVRTGYHCQP